MLSFESSLKHVLRNEGMIYSDYTTGILEFESEEDFWNRKKIQMVSDLLQDIKTDGINLSQIK